MNKIPDTATAAILNNKITLLVPRKFQKTFDEFCRVMNFQIIGSEKPAPDIKIKTWDDIYKLIDRELGPSYQKPQDFVSKIIRVSPTGAAHYFLTLIEETNDRDRGEILRESMVKLFSGNMEYTPFVKEAIDILRDKLLPLLYDKGEQEDKERNP